VEWLDRDRFASLLRWAVRLDGIEAGRAPDARRVEVLLAAAAEAGYRVEALRAALGGRSGGSGAGSPAATATGTTRAESVLRRRRRIQRSPTN
jgi:hypothetical protein